MMLPVAVAMPLAAVSVSVLLAPVVLAALRLAVTPAGSPLVASDTAPVKPPVRAIVMADVALPPAANASDPGLSDSVKPGVGVAVTVSATVVVAESEPLVPVTVITLVPALAALPTLKLSVVEPVVEAGLKLAVTPLGTPLTAKLTALVNPPDGATAIVAAPLAPCASDRLLGLAATV
jgi:hypothetical protein